MKFKGFNEKKIMGVIFPILFYFLNTTAIPLTSGNTEVSDSAKTIYLVKIRWHTGIVFRTQQVDTSVWKFIKDFREFRYVDVGWGDEAFYQHPGFDLDLAIKALFERTGSALRIAGFNRRIKDYLSGTDYAEKIVLSEKEFEGICSYIQSSYFVVKNKPVVLSSHLNGAVKFYKAEGWYTVFNTCNTWIAIGLSGAGLKIDDNIILSEQLFRETVRYGSMVKVPE